ncbi:MAG TPA: hypothetical protein VMJ30_02600, partial [Gemmatimonadales bacterium]|nr:hypothetical protein [Gemmatimonadales bacterium]
MILVSHCRGGRSTPSETAEFSGRFDEMEPTFSADGQHLVFASNRPAPGLHDTMRLWFVERVGEPTAVVPGADLIRDGWVRCARVGGRLLALFRGHHESWLAM